MLKTSGKAEADIIHGYRKKRNYLKAQVKTCLGRGFKTKIVLIDKDQSVC